MLAKTNRPGYHKSGCPPVRYFTTPHSGPIENVTRSSASNDLMITEVVSEDCPRFHDNDRGLSASATPERWVDLVDHDSQCGLTRINRSLVLYNPGGGALVITTSRYSMQTNVLIYLAREGTGSARLRQTCSECQLIASLVGF
jgi:hypothetical protein